MQDYLAPITIAPPLQSHGRRSMISNPNSRYASKPQPSQNVYQEYVNAPQQQDYTKSLPTK